MEPDSDQAFRFNYQFTANIRNRNTQNYTMRIQVQNPDYGKSS